MKLPLRVLVEGVKRPRFYSPVVAKDGESLCDADLVLAITPIREVRQLLTLRAMLQREIGRNRGGVARLVGVPPTRAAVGAGTIIDRSIDRQVLWRTLALKRRCVLAHTADLTAKQAGRWLADLRDLPPPRSNADCWNAGERTLRPRLRLPTGERASQGVLLGALSPTVCPTRGRPNSRSSRMAADPRVDWDEVLRMINAHIEKQIGGTSPAHAQAAVRCIRPTR